MASVTADRNEVRETGRALRWRDRFVGGMVAALIGGVAVGVVTAVMAAVEPSVADPLFLFGYLGGVFTALAAAGVLVVGLPLSALLERRPGRSAAAAVGRYAVAGLLVGPVVGELVTRVGWPGLLVGAPVGAAVGALAAALALARRWGVVALTVAAVVGVLGGGMLVWLVANAIVSS